MTSHNQCALIFELRLAEKDEVKRRCFVFNFLTTMNIPPTTIYMCVYVCVYIYMCVCVYYIYMLLCIYPWAPSLTLCETEYQLSFQKIFGKK